MPPGMGRHTAPLDFPEAPTFRPTWDEFKDFVKYVEYLETTDAPKAGICKIVAPPEWIPRKIGYEIDNLNYSINGPIKQYFNQIGGKGMYQTKGIVKPAMTVKEYYKLAHDHTYRTPTHSSYDDLERKYWKSLAFVPPIYGCDVADRLSDPDLKEWNISSLGSILDTIKDDPEIDIKGVLSPYIYFGMWKATFSWHIEDMDLYAINAIHHGMPKTWYCVPPKYGHLLEKAAREMFPNVASWCSNFMRHKTCMIAPDILEKYGVPFQKIVQEERNIVITWPYAYHSGFNHGFNIAESTNFAMPRWIEYGKRSRPCDCSRSRVSFPMAPFVKKFQPEQYEDWISGRDIAPHPEDPPEVVAEIRLRAENPEAYKALMEKKLKLNLEKRRQSKKLEEGDEDLMEVDVYQHPEQKNIFVQVNPTTMRCLNNGLRVLRDRLQDPKAEVTDLIEKGLLIKIDSTKVPKRKRHLEEDDDDDQGELVDVSVYKHKEDPIQAIVDPVTLDLLGDQAPELLCFLSKTHMPMQTLIKMNVFLKIVDARIKLRKEPIAGQSESKKPRVTHQRKILLLKYRSSDSSGVVIKVHPKTMKPFYKLAEKTKNFLGNQTIQRAVDEGRLVLEGNVEVEASNSTANHSDRGTFEDIRFVELHLIDSGKSFIMASNGNRVAYLCMGCANPESSGVFVEGSLLSVDKMKPLRVEALPEVDDRKKMLKTVLEEVFLHMCPNHAAGKPSSLVCECSVSGLDELAESATEQPKATFSLSRVIDDSTFCISDKKSSEVIFVTEEVVSMNGFPFNEVDDLSVNEEDPEEIVQETPSSDVRDIDFNDSNSEDEMLYTTESSSDSNESSDDPNYGSGRREGLWNRRSNKSKKRKKKLLRKLKLLSREERIAHRALTAEERQRRKELRKEKRAKAVDALSVAELTRSIITYLKNKFESFGEDTPKQFTISELKEKFNEDRSNVVSVVKIFDGLEIVQKDSEDNDEEDVYFWHGVVDDKLDAVFVDILNGGRVEGHSNIWLVFRDFIKALLINRQGGRVHPKVIGKCRFGINETRRVTLSAAILEGLGLVDHQQDNIGGVLWTGRNLFRQWDKEQHRKYHSESKLGLAKLQLRPCLNFTEEQLDWAKERVVVAIDNMIANPTVAMEDLDTEQQRSVANQNVVCKCGINKKTNFEVQRAGTSQTRKSVWAGFKKRTRCKKCPGCLAPKCNECKNCLYPHLKKPCVRRVCQFPVVPKCPCFA